MDTHNGSLEAFDVKYIRVSALHPRYVIAVSAFSKPIISTTEYQEYDAHVK
jgi:hypothetical protein